MFNRELKKRIDKILNHLKQLEKEKQEELEKAPAFSDELVTLLGNIETLDYVINYIEEERDRV